MVLIWTGLAGGDDEYCAILVAINSLLQMIFFAPLAVLFIQVIGNAGDTGILYGPVAANVGVFLGIPLGSAIVTRIVLRTFGGCGMVRKKILKLVGPFSLIGLLFIIIVLFGSQGDRVVHQISCQSCRAAECLFCRRFLSNTTCHTQTGFRVQASLHTEFHRS